MAKLKDRARDLADRVARLPNIQVFTVYDLREPTEVVAELAAQIEALEAHGRAPDR